jgi:hypothetical protein
VCVLKRRGGKGKEGECVLESRRRREGGKVCVNVCACARVLGGGECAQRGERGQGRW